MTKARIFHHWPGPHVTCPLCGGFEDQACVLVPIVGTQEGHRVEAQPAHVDCILSRVEIIKAEKATVIIAGAFHL